MVKIRVAIISDIHGNLAAFEAVLEDIKKENIDKVIALGDLGNELPNANEVISKLKDINAYSIKGNKEEYFLNYEENKYKWENFQFKNTKFMYDLLTNESKEYIRKLPFSLSLNFDGVKIKAVHGSPLALYELVHENDEELLDKYTKDLEEDILFLAHTHNPIWIREKNGKMVVNTGTVGVSVFNIGQAEYVILDAKNGKYDLEKRLIKYDLNKLKSDIIKSGMAENERTFINLVYLALSGRPQIRKEFYRKGQEMMLQKGKKLYRDDAKGIFKTFRLLDDDIWLALTKEVKQYFEI